MDSLNYHKLDDLITRCASGEIDMHDPLELTNHMKNKKIQISILQHFIILCRSDKKSLIHILSRLRCEIQQSLLRLIQSNPFVRMYIQSVIQEWRQTFPPEELFLDGLDQCGYSEGDDLFSYDELVKEQECSQKGGSQMKAIEDILRQRQDNYSPMTSDFAGQMKSRIRDLHQECSGCIDRVKAHTANTMSLQSMITPVHMEVLTDLSGKPKSMYIEFVNHFKSSNDVFDTFMSQSVDSEIPDKIHTVFLNYVITLTMLKKELNYITFSFKDILKEMYPQKKVFDKIIGDVDLLVVDVPMDGEGLSEDVVLSQEPVESRNPIFSFF